MKIKVCGIRNEQNLHFLDNSEVDMIGFIFYEKSKRNFDGGELEDVHLKRTSKAKVGVFVDEQFDEVVDLVHIYDLDFVQLHGQEPVEYCLDLKEKGISIIKAFSVYNELPENVQDYVDAVDYFLFDAKGENPGGNGVQFDWSVLDTYELNVPFILSGGIGPQDVDQLKNIKNEKLVAVDINSGFEIEPGLKDENLLNEFIKDLKGTS